MTLMLLLVAACTGRKLSDTGAGLGPPVTITDGPPPNVGPIDLVIFEQILQTVDPTSGEVLDHQAPVLVGLTLAKSQKLPLTMSTDIEGCWPFDAFNSATDAWAEDVLHVQVGGTTIALQGSGDGIYLAAPMGTDARAAATVGAELSVEKVNTGVTVPQQLEVDDAVASWSGVTEDGHIRLTWTPAKATHEAAFIQVVFDAEGRSETGCVLADDGGADIDLGGPVTSPITLRMGRVEAAIIDHPDLGSVFVGAEQDLELDRP
ncbi:MAG: hypothetical protein GXP62_12810 [Oligoflexia bacterium]|nr:hypothetical protein [Oligoflexia bacterium]